MEGTIVLQEPRRVKRSFADWYNEKFIETGKSAEFEEKFDRGIDIATNTVKTLGTIATVVLIFCPIDGPVGEIFTAVATPILAKLVEKGGQLLKKVIIGDVKRNLIEATYVRKDGSSKSVVIPDGDVVEDANDFSNDFQAFKGGRGLWWKIQW